MLYITLVFLSKPNIHWRKIRLQLLMYFNFFIPDPVTWLGFESTAHVTCLRQGSPGKASRLGLQNTPTASLQRGKTPPNECPAYDTKQSDGEASVMLELWGMQSTSSLPSLSGLLWPEVVALDRLLSMGRIELYLFSIPPPDKYGTRPFLKWVRTQGWGPHASGKIQKCLRPRRHSPKEGTSDARK